MRWKTAAVLFVGVALFGGGRGQAQGPTEQNPLKGHAKLVLCVAFSPDSQALASGSLDETIRLWDVRTGKELATLQGHTGAVSSVAYSPDGQTLASAGADKTIKLSDL